jgi:hypothetical protein
MRNAEHFQIMTEVKTMIENTGADTLKIGRLFDAFTASYRRLDECLLIIQKSGYTAQINEADRVRDSVFRGMCDAVNSMLRHFDPEKTEAARLLKIPLDAYGNLARKPNDEQTAGVYNLLQELEGKYEPQTQITGIADWVRELKRTNAEFDALMKSRDAETAEKPQERLVTVRREIDADYRRITQAAESLAMLADGDGERAIYARFTGELNAVIARYNNRLAAR